jgi:hypothetical protein
MKFLPRGNGRPLFSSMGKNYKGIIIMALLKKSSTRHEFGKIWPNLAIKKIIWGVLSLFTFVVDHSK